MVFLTSCNSCAKSFGGTITVQLPQGKKLITATWKETSLWYLVEPMDSIDKPRTIIFQEESQFDTWEGKVIFQESR